VSASLPAVQTRVAHLINHFPAVSHSFIRREILALERLGINVQRISLRGWDGPLADAHDVRERERVLERHDIDIEAGKLGRLLCLQLGGAVQ
jgi:hypothetical protein